MRLFVSIAAYRDPELLPTVRDLVAKAAAPGALTVAILNQDDAPVPAEAWPAGPRYRLETCAPAESRGVCWARARLQGLYDGEDYSLQLDSHHRFLPGWDEVLVRELARCPSADPLLSAYLPWYRPGKNGEGDRFAPLDGGRLVFSHWDGEGIANFKAPVIEATADAPVPGAFVSGLFIFARGDFVTRVPYDPDIYFTGEEITLAARAWTHGFDIFHPVRAAAWHHTDRLESPRHWDDHARWPDLQARAVEKMCRLFADDPYLNNKDGLGSTRTLAAYEQHAGIALRRRGHGVVKRVED